MDSKDRGVYRVCACSLFTGAALVFGVLTYTALSSKWSANDAPSRGGGDSASRPIWELLAPSPSIAPPDYAPSSRASPSSSSSASTISGTLAVDAELCVRPDTKGYDFDDVVEVSLEKGPSFEVLGVRCVEEFVEESDGIFATQCTYHGQEYSVYGCHPPSPVLLAIGLAFGGLVCVPLMCCAAAKIMMVAKKSLENLRRHYAATRIQGLSRGWSTRRRLRRLLELEIQRDQQRNHQQQQGATKTASSSSSTPPPPPPPLAENVVAVGGTGLSRAETIDVSEMPIAIGVADDVQAAGAAERIQRGFRCATARGDLANRRRRARTLLRVPTVPEEEGGNSHLAIAVAQQEAVVLVASRTRVHSAYAYVE